MTPEKLRELLGKATDLPWKWEHPDTDNDYAEGDWRMSLRTVKEYPTCSVGMLPKFVLSYVEEDEPNHADVCLIVAAVNALPGLLDELDHEVATRKLHERHWTAARDERDKIRAWLCDNGLDAKYDESCDVPGCPKDWAEEVAAKDAEVTALRAKLADAEARAETAEARVACITAQAFHETYERLAPSFGYRTRGASAVLWEAVPGANRRLMEAVVALLLAPAEEAPDDQ